jgi:hypothetical protein
MFLDKELLIDNSLLIRDVRQHFLAYPKYSGKPFSFWLSSNTSDSKHLIQISLRGTFSIPKNIRRGLCCCSNIFLVVPTLFLLDLILDGKRMGRIDDLKYGKAKDELLAGKEPHKFYHID